MDLVSQHGAGSGSWLLRSSRKLLLYLSFLQHHKIYLLVAVAVILVIFDRVYWATISNWGLDEAVNLWLGYVQPFSQIPVGLISSRAIPNPNGMVLFGMVFSRLPGLWFISSFLGILQAFLLVLLCWSWFGKTKLFWIVSTVLLSSAVLRAMSIEFWNQWIMLYINVLFFVFLAWYVERPAVAKIPMLTFVVIFSPSLYLGGISNAVAYLLLFFIAFIRTRKKLDTRGWLPSLTFSLFVAVFFIFATWIPYLRAVQPSALFQGSPDSPNAFLRQVFIALITLVGFVGWNITWALRLIPSIVHFNSQVLPGSAGVLIYLHSFILVYLTFITFLMIGFAGLTSFKKQKNFSETFLPQYQKEGIFIVFAYSFVLICFALTSLLNGPFLINGERMDMTLQFLPFFLIIWFAAPHVVRMPSDFQRLVFPISMALTGVFIVANIALGWQAISTTHHPRKDAAAQYHIPLFQRLDAIQLIVQDWSSKGGTREIPIYYDLGPAYPDYLYKIFGLNYTLWYPHTPYTMGRAFDYELRRVYHYNNSQEGIPNYERDKAQAEYIVRYSFIPREDSETCYTEHIFGYINVLVRDPDSQDCFER